MAAERDFRRCNTWPVRTSINFNVDVASAAATLEEENECDRRIAEAGDDGGRSLFRRRRGGGEMNWNSDINAALEMGLWQEAPHNASSNFPTPSSREGRISPVCSHIFSPSPLSGHSASSTGGAKGCKQPEDTPQPPKHNEEQLTWRMERVSVLTYLAFFGIIGVLIRDGLQVLFAPTLNVTNDYSPLYIDLPSNMVGSFFMGWVGVVFKRDISHFSEFLAIGLSTGLMGSITTFTAWIQEMINLTTKGHWARGLIGVLLGMELAYMSLLIGIGTAELLKQKSASIHNKIREKILNLRCILSTNNHIHQTYGLIIFLTIGGILWIGALVISIEDFMSHHGTKLFFACIVGPIGVWIRWYLATLNGQGIGAQKHLKWLPVGTLLTNLIATCLMATLSLINLSVKDNNSKLLLGGLELGLLGCMSTVSTFVVETHAMYQSSHPWRAFAYVFFTLVVAIILETLIYSIPIWMNE